MAEKLGRKFTRRFAKTLRRMIEQYRSRGRRMGTDRSQQWWQPSPVPALVPVRGR